MLWFFAGGIGSGAPPTLYRLTPDAEPPAPVGPLYRFEDDPSEL